MNAALAVAQAVAGADVGAIFGGNMLIGRRVASHHDNDGKSWSVVQGVGSPRGGNLASWKQRVPIQVSCLVGSWSAEQLYDIDAKVRSAIMAIPNDNPSIPFIQCSTLGDEEAEAGEQRVGVWQVEAVTITDGRFLP